MNEADERDKFHHPRKWTYSTDPPRYTQELDDKTVCCYVRDNVSWRPEISNELWGFKTECGPSFDKEGEAKDWLWDKHKEWKEEWESRQDKSPPAGQDL